MENYNELFLAGFYGSIVQFHININLIIFET